MILLCILYSSPLYHIVSYSIVSYGSTVSTEPCHGVMHIVISSEVRVRDNAYLRQQATRGRLFGLQERNPLFHLACRIFLKAHWPHHQIHHYPFKCVLKMSLWHIFCFRFLLILRRRRPPFRQHLIISIPTHRFLFRAWTKQSVIVYPHNVENIEGDPYSYTSCKAWLAWLVVQHTNLPPCEREPVYWKVFEHHGNA